MPRLPTAGGRLSCEEKAKSGAHTEDGRSTNTVIYSAFKYVRSLVCCVPRSSCGTAKAMRNPRKNLDCSTAVVV